MNIIRLAGCIILNNQKKILLMHRSTKNKTQWEIPGGKIEKDEEPNDTALREVSEEVGIKVAILKHVATRSFWENGHEMEYTWFLSAVKSGLPKVLENEKFDSLNYFSWREIEDMKTELSAGTRKLLDTYLAKEIRL